MTSRIVEDTNPQVAVTPDLSGEVEVHVSVPGVEQTPSPAEEPADQEVSTLHTATQGQVQNAIVLDQSCCAQMRPQSITLSVDEIALIIKQINDPQQRISEGLKYFPEGSEQWIDCAVTYSKGIINSTKSDLRYGVFEGLETVLEKLAQFDERAQQLAVLYIQRRLLDINEEHDTSNDWTVEKLYNFAEKISIIDRVRVGFVYFVDKRLAEVEDISQKLDTLTSLCEKLSIERPIIQIFEWSKCLFYFSSVNEIPVDRIGEIIDILWGKFKNCTGVVPGLANLLRYPNFRAKYGTDPRAVELAKLAISEEIINCKFELVKELCAAYEISDIHGPTRDAVVSLITGGRFQIAGEAANAMEYTITSDDVNSARSALESSMAETVRKSGVQATLHLARRLKALDEYAADGAMNINQIETVDLPDGYSGKFMLVEFQGITFLTVGNQGNRRYHSEIKDGFKNNLNSRGFEGEVKSLGGGHIKVSEDKIRIYGRSEDYGQCDKVLAKELVAKIYPNRDIIAEED